MTAHRSPSTPLTNHLSPAEMEKLLGELHPSIREHFVYMPNPRAASPEELHAAFPFLHERKDLFYRMWREAIAVNGNAAEIEAAS